MPGRIVGLDEIFFVAEEGGSVESEGVLAVDELLDGRVLVEVRPKLREVELVPISVQF